MVSDSSSFKPSERKLCAKGCGFFGSASTLGLCSKCYRDDQVRSAEAALHRLKDEISDPIPAAEVSSPAEREVVPLPDRCRACNKRVKIACGFKCRCGFLFCASHRYPEEHICPFDYKALAKYKIAKANPMVKADKIQRI